MNALVTRWRTHAPTAAARIVYWVYGYIAFEWLFFATKNSVVSSAGWGARITMLLVPPLAWLAVALPLQLLFCAMDAAISRGSRRWWSAILPATMALLLLVIGAENFARTVVGVSIVDVTGGSRALAVAGLLGFWVWLFRRAACRTEKALGVYVRGAVALLVCSGAAFAVLLAGSTDFSSDRSSLPADERSRPVERPNILLIGIDGVPAERMSVYGASRRTTPFLERLGQRATLFENAFSNAGVTCGSLISLLTGRRPTETHIFRCPVYLDGPLAERHLPAMLRSAGYAAAQIGVDRQADAIDWNMRGAFDEVNGRVLTENGARRSLVYARVRRFRTEIEARIADRLLHLAGIRAMTDTHRLLTGQASDEEFSDKARLALAREFIRGQREPWLLQIHLMDTHCCDFGFAPRRFSSRTKEGDSRWIEDRTDDALLQVDGYLEQIHGELEASGQLERTMIVIYSDHSIGWGTNERLPLIVSLPRQESARRVSTNAQLLDIAPTVLDHIGLPQPPWMTGQSLLDSSDVDHLRPVFGLWGSWDPAKSRVRGRALYEARTASVVVCDHWVEMSLADGSVVREGLVEGHTRRCGPRNPGTSPASLLATHLRSNGYPIPLRSTAPSRNPALAAARASKSAGALLTGRRETTAGGRTD